MSHQRAIASEPTTTNESALLKGKTASPESVASTRVSEQFGENFNHDFSQIPISHPNDTLELEADHTAKRLLSGRPPARITSSSHTSAQAKANQQPSISTSPQSSLGRGGGRPLPKSTRHFFESRFQQDFGQVRIHANGHGDRIARQTNAQALTYGNEIYFRHSQFQPNTPTGQSLIAHELTHTLQQRHAEPLIARLIATPETSPTVENPVADNPNEQQTASVDSIAQSILRDFRNDPADQDRSISRRLQELDPLSRQVVLSRVRVQLTPEEQGQLGQALTSAMELNESNPQEQNTSDETTRSAVNREETSRTDESNAPSTPADPQTEQVRTQASQLAQDQAIREVDTPDISAPSDTGASETEQAMAESQSDTAETTAESSDQANDADDASREATEGSEADASDSTQAEEQGGEAEEATSLRDLLEPAPQDADPSADTGSDDYDLAAAQAEVQRLIGEIQTSADTAEQTISAASGSSQATITGAAQSAREDIQNQVATVTEQIVSEIDTRRTQINDAFSALDASISSEFDARQNETTEKGEASQDRLSGYFDTHRININTTVDDKISEANQLTERHVQSVEKRTGEQAEEARGKGRTKARSINDSDYEREQVQRNAIMGVADRTAEEIEVRKPETVQAIRDITVDIPDEFREKGQEALDGFDEGLPDLLAQVDTQIGTVIGQLQQHHDLTREQLQENQIQLMTQLDGLQSSVTAQLQAIVPQAEAQITAAEQAAQRQLQMGPQLAIARIREVAEEAVQILNEAETPDIESSQAMANQIKGFIEGASADAIGSLQQGTTQIATKFNQVKTQARDGIEKMQTQAKSDLQTLSDNAQSTLTEAETSINTAFSTTMESFEASLSEAEIEVETQLDQALTDFTSELNTPLDEAETEINQAEREGLAKNDEALRDLDGQMREAASDAAWDYDHPVLSTIADIGAIVLGVIAGILVVIALVVVVIVAFKLIIAGLVAAGISLAVAKLIVAVGALGLLAYGVYSAYQETGSIGDALLKLTGLQDIANAFTEPGLSPFERGFAFGRGVATVATFFIGRGMGKSINSRFARIGSVPNPQGRVNRIIHFAENPRAISQRGSRIANRLGLAEGQGLDRGIQAGGNRLGSALQRGGNAFSQTRPGQALSRAGQRIDQFVESGFQRTEQTAQQFGAATRGVRNFLSGRNPSPARSGRPALGTNGSSSTTASTPPSTQRQQPSTPLADSTVSNRPPAAANDNALPLRRPTPANDNAIPPRRPIPANDNAIPPAQSRGTVRRGSNAGEGFTREGDNVVRPDRLRGSRTNEPPPPPRPEAPAQAVPEESTFLSTGTDDVPVLSRPNSPRRPDLRSCTKSASSTKLAIWGKRVWQVLDVDSRGPSAPQPGSTSRRGQGISSRSSR